MLVPDVSKDSRYINAVTDVRSELVIPLLLKDRCVGVFDLESPELDAFSQKHVELLTLLASQAAVAIENARLYESIRANEVRFEKEVRFAQRVQLALLPQELPKRLKGVEVAWHFDPARELGGDLYEFLSPEANTLVVAVGDVSGKGVPAALYSSFVGEVVRGRTFRRRFTPELGSPANLLTSLNRILYERQLEEYFCTLCYAAFDFKRRTIVIANSGLPFPVHVTGDSATLLELPGLPLGSFGGSSYDELNVEMTPNDVFVFCSDGISETFNAAGEEFGSTRVVGDGARAPERVRQGDRLGGVRRDAGIPRRRAADRRSDRRRRQDRFRTTARRTRRTRRARRTRRTAKGVSECDELSGALSALLLALMAAPVSAQPTGSLQQELRSQLRSRLESIAARLDGVLGYVVVDLTSKETVAAAPGDTGVPDGLHDQARDSLRAAEAGRRRQARPGQAGTARSRAGGRGQRCAAAPDQSDALARRSRRADDHPQRQHRHQRRDRRRRHGECQRAHEGVRSRRHPAQAEDDGRRRRGARRRERGVAGIAR